MTLGDAATRFGPARLTAANSADGELARVAALIAGTNLLVAGCWLWVSPPEAVGQPGMAIASTCVAVAVFASLAVSNTWIRWGRTLAVLLIAVLFVATQNLSGLLGWWPQTELAIVAALGVVTLRSRMPMALLGSALLLVAVVAASVGGADTDLVVASPVLIGARLVRLGVIAGIFIVFSQLIVRAARAVDAATAGTLEAEAGVAFARERERSERAAARVVHDTALNTLEAVARGVPESLVTRFAERSRADALAVARIGVTQESAGGPLLAALASQASQLGITLVDAVRYDGDPPEPMGRAIGGAGGEAIRNVSKHAGVDQVIVQGHLGASESSIRIIDGGCGFDTGSRQSIGLRESIIGRMRDAGGDAQIWSALGRGTAVELTSGTASARARVDLVAQIRRALLWLALGAAVLALVGIFADTAGLARPWIAVVNVFAVLAATLWLVRAPITDGSHVLVAASVLVAVTIAAPLADPYCTSWLRGSGFADNHLVLLLAIALLTPRLGQTIAVCLGYFAASAVASMLASRVWPGCGDDYLITAIAELGVIVGVVAFGRVTIAREDALSEQLDRELRVIVDAANEAAQVSLHSRWDSPTTARAVGLLTDLGSGLANPGDPLIRREAGEAARDLRTLAMLSTDEGILGQAMHLIFDWCVQNSTPMIVKGVPAELKRDADASLLTWARSLCSLGPTLVEMTITATRLWQVVLIHAEGVFEQIPIDADTWVDEDGLWLRLELLEPPKSDPP